MEHLAAASSAQGRVVSPQLDDPPTVASARDGRREVEDETAPVGTLGFERSRERSRGIDDEYVSRPEERREVAETRMSDRAVVPPGSQHANVVAKPPVLFGRGVRLELLRELECEAGAHVTTA
jgi:hypothetical protein